MNIDQNLQKRIENILKYTIEPLEVDVDYMSDILEEIVSEYENLQDKYNDLEEDIRENYEPKKFDPYLEYGVSEKDFI